MAQFQIRVELFDADWDDYVTLAKCLAAQGIVDIIPSTTGKVYKLPPAEYYLQGDFTRPQVLEMIKACATKVATKYAAVVGECAGISWHGLDTA